MLNKKIILLIILIVSLSAISTVNATEELNCSYIDDVNDLLVTSDYNAFENDEIITVNSHTITSDNYDSYFDNNGVLKSDSVKNNDTINIEGNFSNKKFVFENTVNIVGSNSNHLENCVFTLNKAASGSSIINLKIINTNDETQGIFLNSATNCTIQGCDINNTGMASYCIVLANNANFNNVTYNNLTAYGIIHGQGTRSTAPLILSGSHNNYIAYNHVEADDANAIYLSSYAGGPLLGGNSNYNLIFNNTIHYNVLPTSWAYGIQVIGSNNEIKSNTIIGAYRGISTSGRGNVIKSNLIINLTGCDYNDPEIETGGEYAIVASYNSTVISNVVIGAKIIPTGAGITLLDNSIVEDNWVNVTLNGKGIVNCGYNVTIKNNVIFTESGPGVYEKDERTGLKLENNYITSFSGMGILIEKLSSKRTPSNITIINNTIYISSHENAINTTNIPNVTIISNQIKLLENNTSPLITKSKINVFCEKSSISFGENATFLIRTNIDGKINVKINSFETTVTTINNTAVINIPNLDASFQEYTVKFTLYPHLYNYSQSSNYSSIKVNKSNSNITVSNINTIYNIESIIIANVTSNNNIINEGSVAFYKGTELIGNASVINGSARLSYIPNDVGESIITAVYNSNNYFNSTNSAKMFVDSFNIEILAETGSIESESIIIANVKSLYNSINDGFVTFYINDEYLDKCYIVNGTSSIAYTPLSAGNYTIKATYNINNNLSYATNTTTYFVKDYSKVVVSDLSFDYGTLIHSNFIIDGAIGITVNITNVDDYIVNVTDNTIFVYNLDAGNYDLSVTTIPDDYHIAVTETYILTVNKIDSYINISDIIFDYGYYGYSNVELNNANSFSATVTNHPEAAISISDNFIIVSGLDAGDYTLVATTFADKNYNVASANAKIRVNKVNSSATIPDILFNYNQTGISNFILDGATGIKDAFVLNHPEARIFIENNSIKLSNLSVGSYKLITTTNPDKNHNSIISLTNITVNKLSTSIAASAITTIYNGGKYLVARLTDGQGNPINGATVSINIKSVKTLTTNANGQVKLTTNGIAPNSYTATISFLGNSNYAKYTTTAKIVVKKATPKLTAKSKTFKKSLKTKKYSITLKTNQNKFMKNTKVTIKINKKTYTAKTNAKGIATFKITKLTKKGTFKSVITYKGSSYYNKITKTVKIKCR